MAKSAGKGILYIFVCVLTMAVNAQPAVFESGKFIVAFGNIEAVDLPSSLAKSVTELLQEKFTNHFILVDRADIEKVMQEHAFQQMVAEEIADVGRILGAEKLIFGSVRSVEYSNAFSLSLRMVDVAEARIELAEFVEIIPRTSMDEAVNLIAGIFTGQVQRSGVVTDVVGDTILTDFGSDIDLAEEGRLSVRSVKEGEEYEKAELLVLGSDGSILRSVVLRTSGMIMKGDSVVTREDIRRVERLRERLDALGNKERSLIKEKRKRADELEARKVETEIIREERRKREAMTLNKLRLSAGWFMPWDAAFKDDYTEEGEEFNFDHPVYSIHLYPGSHRYYRFYWKGTYYERRRRDGEFTRKIATVGGGVRIQFPVAASREFMLVPYGGAGLDYSWMLDSEVGENTSHNGHSGDDRSNIEGIYGMGREVYVGFELVYDKSIGLFYGITRHWAEVGEDDLQIGGEIRYIGVDIWF